MNLLSIFLDHPNKKVAKKYTYQCEDALYEQLSPGSCVVVPFSGQKHLGYILKKWIDNDPQFNYDIKKVTGISSKDVLNESQKHLINFLKSTYLIQFKTALEMTYPHKVRHLKVKTNQVLHQKQEYVRNYQIYVPTKELSKLLNKKYQLISNESNITKIDLIEKYDFNEYQIKKFVENRVLIPSKIAITSYHQKVKINDINTLSSKQMDAMGKINDAKNDVILKGKTASGKTEIYIKLINEMIKNSKQAVFIVPEKTLAEQMHMRLSKHYPNQVALYTSELSVQKQFNTYQNLKQNNIKVVLGTKEALFLNYQDLGLVIVDEEHAYNYKNHKAPYYHVRDICEYLKKQFYNLKILYASATPRVDTMARVKNGNYQLVTLDEKYYQTTLEYQFVNPNDRDVIFMPDINYEIQKQLQAGKKVIIYHPRRGFSSGLECEKCYKIPMCHNCKIPLNYSKDKSILYCNHCNFDIKFHNRCSNCKNTNTYKEIGFGIEKIKEQLAIYFNDYPIHMLDKKVTKTDRKKILKSFADNNPQILIGTSVIVNGLDFKNVGAVIISNIDASLKLNDIDATENVYQTLKQISGRAGRDINAKIIIQTRYENHKVFEYIKNDNDLEFYQFELNNRKLLRQYPFYNFAKITIGNVNQKAIYGQVMAMVKKLEKKYQIEVINKPYINYKRSKNNPLKFITISEIIIRYKRENIANDLEKIINHANELGFECEVDMNYYL